MTDPRISFIGAGNMAASLIGGLLAQGIPAQSLRAADPGEAQRQQIGERFGIATFADNAAAVADADVVLLAVKPQVMKAVCESLAPHLAEGTLVISIAAGISCDSLQRWLAQPGRPTAAVVRCMPNTPALLRQGVSGLFASAEVSADQRALAERLLSAVGLALWLDDESLIDAVTAVSGSGPAYFFLMVEAMTAAGVRLGLPQATADQLSRQTALGAARMLCESDVEAAELRRRVTSPNGTTEAAIKAFQAGDFEALVQRALDAAAARSGELAEQLGR
ncbi:pyrroline-5-carboxylate reductase [Stutzerimonas urumqiensis]|uniref:pyrroline-5-carboxylate reductase n=1 Tax=Stutzerimonas urumqiensis TaxID=638269 RepID=UPI000EACD267|nr:pyrroline-5-carboxylate reductase [Stutzerimonas urumqiensis]